MGEDIATLHGLAISCAGTYLRRAEMPQLEEMAAAPELKLPAEKTAALEAAYRTSRTVDRGGVIHNAGAAAQAY